MKLPRSVLKIVFINLKYFCRNSDIKNTKQKIRILKIDPLLWKAMRILLRTNQFNKLKK